MTRHPTPSPQRFPRRRAGFTIIELMIVVVVLGILAALVGPNAMELLDDGNETAMSQELKTVEHALLRHRREFGRFPASIQKTGAATASAMTFAGSPNLGAYVEASSATSITVRTRSTQLRSKECRQTFAYGQNGGVECTALAAEWTGTDPAAP